MSEHTIVTSAALGVVRGRLILQTLGLIVTLACPAAFACEVDADCPGGGTCIKREKRASGVCYGRSNELPQAPAAAVVPRPVEGVRRERATEFLGDPEQNIKDHFPGKEVGAACMVDQDCPAGLLCVIAGFEGRCVNL